ncbi:hypothetical protein T492DRAFT_882027 [Pavlovales sp. CCMP2436]|nr:hypothetical protein T492DRAFT_882027 [Pavlovales sp. CCMP2436]
MELDSAAAAVERACAMFQVATDPQLRAEAERVLLDFRAAENAVSLGLGVLARARSSTAQFHALGAVRDGLAREWGTLGTDARAQLEGAVLGLLGPTGLDHAVQAKACELLGAIAKLDALDALGEPGPTAGELGGGGTSARLLAHASALFGVGEAQKLAALALLNALLLEFGSPPERDGGAVGGGLSAALQVAARSDFQRRHLLPLFDALVRQIVR